MTPDSTAALGRELPENLQARLSMIIQTVPLFWNENKHYNHFTNHGPEHSERVHNQKLAQLAQELPEARRLSPDEIFVVSAAAWLYETGMQSPNLQPILDLEFSPGDSLSFLQLQEIRGKKHLLTERLIIDSLRGDYHGKSLQLGLLSPRDDYTQLIAEVCRWCSDDPLMDVPETSPVGGVPVRVRLLVALLRLADQLYIDRSRVNLDLLEVAKLPEEQFAKYWVYHYAQTLPIVNGQIRFHYFLPVTQKQYLGHIRSLIEPDFKFENNSTIRYLWEQGLRLVPHGIPTAKFDQPAGFQREMNPELISYLRREVEPMQVPLEVLSAAKEEPEERCLLVLDYENLILQLGQEGFFFSPEEVGRLVVTLLNEASLQHYGPVDGIAVGHWSRPDLHEAAQMLEAWTYRLVTVGLQQTSSEKLERELIQHLQDPNSPSRLILVAPDGALAPTVKRLTENLQSVSAWISGLPGTEIYQAIVRKPKSLQNVLRLRTPVKAVEADFAMAQYACILRLDDAITLGRKPLILSEIRTLLSRIEQLDEQVDWWQLWLLSRSIVLVDSSGEKPVQLNSGHPSVRETREMRRTVIKTMQRLLSRPNEGLRQDHLVDELQHSDLFPGEDAIKGYLTLLKEEDILHRDARPGLPEGLHMWFLNPSHWTVVALGANHYLPRFALALNQVLVRERYPFIHEHALERYVAPYMQEGLTRTVYEVALAERWVLRQSSYDRSRHRDVENVCLDYSHPDVGLTMRNADILLNILYHKSARDGIEGDELRRRLSRIGSFTVDHDELGQWLEVLEHDSIIAITDHTETLGGQVVRVNLGSRLTQSLLGKMYSHGLVRNLRILRATRPDRKVPSSEVLERLTKFVTNHDRQLASWTLDYAEGIKLVQVVGNSVFLSSRHSFVRDLDCREEAACQALSALVKTLAQRSRDGWIPRYVVLREMEADRRFGFVRGEHQYWLDQAIYRQKLLEQRQERTNRRPQWYVRVRKQ